MELKYASVLQLRPDQPCPCGRFSACARPASFRFLHNPASEEDFVPPTVMTGLKDRDKCDRVALSFFGALREARARYFSLSKRVDVASRYGGYIGKIDPEADNGLVNEPSAGGHFNLHPAANVSFAPRVCEYHDAT